MGDQLEFTATHEIDLIFEKQRQFFRTGKTKSYAFRMEMLGKLKMAITDNLGEIHAALREDLGKPELESLAAETSIVLEEIQWAMKKLKKWMTAQKVSSGLILFPAKSYVYYEPLGTSLIISPWNYPVQLLLSPLVGSIAAGNTCILKPSELAPASANVIQKMVRENFSEDFLSIVQGGVEETTHLINRPFDKIFYTGSTKIGKIVMQKASQHLSSVTLELGGKSPCIVFADEDLEMAARRVAWGKFFNAGQTCVAPDYVLIREDLYESFVSAVKKSVQDFFGEYPNQSEDYCHIVNISHFERLRLLLEKTGSEAILFGGEKDDERRKISPTLIESYSDQEIMQDEIFGPLLPILKVKSLEEALQFISARPKPLALYYFDEDVNNQHRVLARTSSGGVCFNDTLVHLNAKELPFGGVGGSGMGRYHGKDSFTCFSNKRSVMRRYFKLDIDLRYPPYTEKKLNSFKKFIKLKGIRL